MPCAKCNSDFNLLNWKIKCGECEDKYCNKCLKKFEGILYCEKCMVLLKRPPDRGKLMELKVKDLQHYLKKHNISTHGLVEKQELVDLLCNKQIPVKQKKSTEKFTANIGCSLPNFRENQTLGELWDTIGGDIFRNNSGDGRRNNAQENSNSSNKTAKSASGRSSLRTSPNSTAQFRSPISTEESTSGIPFSSDSRCQAASLSETSLGSEWVYVNRAGSSEDFNHQNIPEGSALPPKCPKLSEFESEEDLNKLSGKQLKILLSLNRVDYKGCVEKKELLDKASTLWKDNKKNKEDVTEGLEDLCKLCMDAPLDSVLLECGHIATCLECGKQLAECPICRQYVSRVVRTFKA